MKESLSAFLEDQHSDQLDGDDLWAIIESLDSVAPPLVDEGVTSKDSTGTAHIYSSSEIEAPSSKRPRISVASSEQQPSFNDDEADGQQRMSHITVERNRRKQMNEHLSVLRSLMPCFYVKRGDQASIIGGVVDYINELQQVLLSLEAKKQRKLYSCEVPSPRNMNMVASSNSPRLPSPLISPRKPHLSSPRLINLPISPRTPQPCSPYRAAARPTSIPAAINSPTHSSSSSSCINNTNDTNNNVNDQLLLVANSKSPVADVEVKFSGANLLLKTVSPRIPGQAVKIISALQDLSLEILHVNISTADETLLNSFTVKIGIECQLSAEELAQQIQQTFVRTQHHS